MASLKWVAHFKLMDLPQLGKTQSLLFPASYFRACPCYCANILVDDSVTRVPVLEGSRTHAKIFGLPKNYNLGRKCYFESEVCSCRADC
jgi:hypothetical protein